MKRNIGPWGGGGGGKARGTDIGATADSESSNVSTTAHMGILLLHMKGELQM